MPETTTTTNLMDHFEGALPSWSQLASLSSPQRGALCNVLVMAAIADGSLSRDEWALLVEAAEQIGAGDAPRDQEIAGRLIAVQDLVRGFKEDEDGFGEYLETLQEYLGGVTTETLRLMAICIVPGGASVQQQNFYYSVAEGLGEDDETASLLLRSAWSAQGGEHGAVREAPAGVLNRSPRERHGRSRRWNYDALSQRYVSPIEGGPAH